MDDDMLKRTKAFWEPRYGRKLSDEEAREIVENAVGFFRILEEWESRGDDTEGTSDAHADAQTDGSP